MLLFGLGCTPDLTAQYAAERAEALQVASGTPASWSPDLVLQLSTPAVAEALTAAAGDALTRLGRTGVPLPRGVPGRLVPALTLGKAEVAPAQACSPCLDLRGRITGTVAWTLGPTSAEVPVSSDLAATVALATSPGADGTAILAQVREVKALGVRVQGAGALRLDADGIVGDVLEEALSTLPPVQLAFLPHDGLPVRDLRLATEPGGVAVALLSDVAGGRPVAAHAFPETGLQLVVNGAVLEGLARREAAKAGVQAMEVAADPRHLRVAGSTFELDLRVWRLVGRGWYRDYLVKGDVSVERGRLRLRARDAAEVAQSRGAELVDPLAALLESKLLDLVVDQVSASFAARRTEKVGGVRLRATATHAEGADGDLVITGPLVVER